MMLVRPSTEAVRQSLLMALTLAITEREHQEAVMGYTMDSAILATWKQIREELKSEA